MEAVYWVGALSSAVALLANAAMLWLQANALRRHGHRSFRLLVAGSVLAILYLIASLPLYFMRLGEDTYLGLALGSGAAFSVATVLGLIGTAQLFNSYGELAERACQSASS